MTRRATPIPCGATSCAHMIAAASTPLPLHRRPLKDDSTMTVQDLMCRTRRTKPSHRHTSYLFGLPAIVLVRVVALLTCGAFSVGRAQGAEQADRRCDGQLASKQCVDLTRKWRRAGNEKDGRAQLEIAEGAARSRFAFVLDVVRGGSVTHLEESFELKADLGLYHGPGTEEAMSICAIVFAPLSPRKIKVVSFGACIEGFGTTPDGIYKKVAK